MTSRDQSPDERDPPVLAPGPGRVIGRRVTRLEDRPLVRGQGMFAADVNFPHQLTMRVVRAQIAHGRILSVDVAPARALEGVVAVWTAEDVAEIPPIPFRATKVRGLEPYCQPILARDFVRYVGEPVAVVFARDAYVAEDAADLVKLEMDRLPVVLDAAAEAGEFLPGLSTEPTIIHKEYGEVDAAFAAAHTTVALELSIGRHSGVPLETRGAISRYDASRDVLELHGTAKKQHWNRDEIARLLNRPSHGVHLYEGHVGGGFGVRGELYPEDILVCLGALRLSRPIKWIEDRREHLIATNHSRQQTHRIRAAVDEQGRLLAIDDVFFHDQGAYVRTHGARVADLAAGMLPGPYRLPAYRVNGHFRLTNKTPAATYRAPGRYETTFVRERLMDAIAEKHGPRSHRGAAAQSCHDRRDAAQAGGGYPWRGRRSRLRGLRAVAGSGARSLRLARRPRNRWCNAASAAKSSEQASPISSKRAGWVPPMAFAFPSTAMARLNWSAARLRSGKAWRPCWPRFAPRFSA